MHKCPIMNEWSTICNFRHSLLQASKKVHDLAAVIPKLKSRKKRLLVKKQEETMGANHSSYKFQNISEIEEDSRLLGKKGIRLKVYTTSMILVWGLGPVVRKEDSAIHRIVIFSNFFKMVHLLI